MSSISAQLMTVLPSRMDIPEAFHTGGHATVAAKTLETVSSRYLPGDRHLPGNRISCQSHDAQPARLALGGRRGEAPSRTAGIGSPAGWTTRYSLARTIRSQPAEGGSPGGIDGCPCYQSAVDPWQAVSRRPYSGSEDHRAECAGLGGSAPADHQADRSGYAVVPADRCHRPARCGQDDGPGVVGGGRTPDGGLGRPG